MLGAISSSHVMAQQSTAPTPSVSILGPGAPRVVLLVREERTTEGQAPARAASQFRWGSRARAPCQRVRRRLQRMGAGRWSTDEIDRYEYADKIIWAGPKLILWSHTCAVAVLATPGLPLKTFSQALNRRSSWLTIEC